MSPASYFLCGGGARWATPDVCSSWQSAKKGRCPRSSTDIGPERRHDDPAARAQERTASPAAGPRNRIETLLLSAENITSCSGLKAPYGEMFLWCWYEWWLTWRSWIDPYSDAYSTPPTPHPRPNTHTSSGAEPTTGREKTCECWLNAQSSSLSLCVSFCATF